jgi:hypothetical protein
MEVALTSAIIMGISGAILGGIKGAAQGPAGIARGAAIGFLGGAVAGFLLGPPIAYLMALGAIYITPAFAYISIVSMLQLSALIGLHEYNTAANRYDRVAAVVGVVLAVAGAATGVVSQASTVVTDDLTDLGISNLTTSNGTLTRLAQDVNVDPNPPAVMQTAGRRIGPSATQNADCDAEEQAAIALGATDIRKNQQQVNYFGVRVGTNRPDLSYSLNGQRFYFEWDSDPNSGLNHLVRIMSNDPNGIVIRKTMR